MGFVQVAKIEKLSADEIKNSIDDEPNNNIAIQKYIMHHLKTKETMSQ